jgi:DNA invertase Pin-like site-specific DNA recombinase
MLFFTTLESFRRRDVPGRSAILNSYDQGQPFTRFGRPSKLSAENAKLAKRLLEEGKSAMEVAKTFGVDRSTIYWAMASQTAGHLLT